VSCTARAEGVPGGADPPRRERGAERGARAHAGAGGRGARAGGGTSPDVGGGAHPAGADRADGRDSARAGARRNAADRDHEPADPMMRRSLLGALALAVLLPALAMADAPDKFDPARDAAA